MILELIQLGLNITISVSTPEDRWNAARTRFTTEAVDFQFIFPIVFCVVILMTIFFTIRWRKEKKQKFSKHLFYEKAKKKGLSRREYNILLKIVAEAELDRKESVFILSSAFDRAVVKMITESTLERGAEASKKLRAELSLLREKLNYRKQLPVSINSMMTSNKLSSRQIPIGRSLQIKYLQLHNSPIIDSTIIETDDTGLTVKLKKAAEYTQGDILRVNCFFDGIILEFDTSVVSCNGNILVLNHQNNVRFVNRRRFPRVPTNISAFVAKAPPGTDATNKPSKLFPAVITELAGPGLLISSPLLFNIGEKVFVKFELVYEETESSNPEETNETAMSVIIEDVGIVRNVITKSDNLLTVVELTELGKSTLNDLIRATYAAYLRTEDDKNSDASEKPVSHIELTNKVLTN